MLWSMLKWALPMLMVTLAAGAALTRKTFEVEAIIAAPADAVWDVLTDTASYPDWNPVFVEVEGTYAEGARVLNRVRDPEGEILEMTAEVRAFHPERELRQTGGIPGILTFDHRWLLETVEGGTRVTQHEVDRGIYLWFWNSGWIEPAYASVLTALDHRVSQR